MSLENTSRRVLFSFITLTFFSFIAGCGKFQAPPGDESGYLSGHEVKPGDGSGDQSGDASGGKGNGDSGLDAQHAARQIVLDQSTMLRYMKNDVLEFSAEIPLGAQILIPADYLVQQANFRQTDGTVAWSSTGYIQGVTILSVPQKYSAQFPQERIDQLNQVSGGLYVFASIIGSLEGVDGAFDAVAVSAPGAGYSKFYELSGKPKFNFSAQIRKRWGAHVNHAVDSSAQSSVERIKWSRIYEEMRKAADRTVQTPKAYLMIDKALAVKLADTFEKTGAVPASGAWTIAVQVTAPKHGFAPTPCAEFMSEIVREAYTRAGYDVSEDFNTSKGNRLLWSDTAAVIKFSNALDKGGWIPWDTSQYRPPIGAVMMNEQGQTPGHTYLAAGDDGRIILDNGSPQGRDLRKTIEHTIDIMFKQGVFFLPPGIIPQKW